MKGGELDALESLVIKLKPQVLFIDRLFEYSSEFIHRIKQHTRVLMFHNLCEGGFNSDTFILPAAHIPENVLLDPKWDRGGAKLLHGFEYILINEQISALKGSISHANRNAVPLVIITTGGSDPEGVLLKLINFLPDPELSPYHARILVGESFMHGDELDALNLDGLEHLQVMPYDTKAFLDCNFSIATFGVTTYELLYLDIPQLSVGHSLRNAAGSKMLSNKCKMIVDMGLIDKLSKEKFQAAFFKMISESDCLARGECVIDGHGRQRIVDEILSLSNE